MQPFRACGPTFSPFSSGKKGPTWSGRMLPFVFQPCSTPSNPKLALWANYWSQMAIFRIFGPLFGFLGAISGKFWSSKSAELVSLDVLGAVPTLFQPVPQQSMVLRPIHPILSYLCLLLQLYATFRACGPIFSPCSPGTNTQHGSMGCPKLCLNLFPPLSTQIGPLG